MNVGRTTSSVSFNTGISTAEYSEVMAGQTPGQTQKPLLPGSTTVSEALDGVFPKNPSILSVILGEMAAAGNNPALRTARGFRAAAEKTIATLQTRSGAASKAAAVELGRMLEDEDLLDSYLAAILES